MTTVSAAIAAIRTRIEANTPTRVIGHLRWQNEDADPLPEVPAPFLYTEIDPDKQYIAGFGGGAGGNLWRTPARANCFAFVPRGEGIASATDLAETVAALFRGYRSGDLQCFGATVYPVGTGGAGVPGLANEADNYYAAVAEIEMHFDLVG